MIPENNSLLHNELDQIELQIHLQIIHGISCFHKKSEVQVFLGIENIKSIFFLFVSLQKRTRMQGASAQGNYDCSV